MARVPPGVRALRQQQLAGMQQVTAGNPALQQRKPAPHPPQQTPVQRNVAASRQYLGMPPRGPTLGQAAGGRPQPVRGGGGAGSQRNVPRPPAGRPTAPMPGRARRPGGTLGGTAAASQGRPPNAFGVNPGMQSVLQNRGIPQTPPARQPQQPWGGGLDLSTVNPSQMAPWLQQMGGMSGMSGGNMAWNNPQDPMSGYQPQYGGQQGGGYGNQMSNMGGGYGASAGQYGGGGFMGGNMAWGQQGGSGGGNYQGWGQPGSQLGNMGGYNGPSALGYGAAYGGSPGMGPPPGLPPARPGQRPWSAGGQGNPSGMMTTTMYPEEMNQPANPWAGGMSPSQGPMGYGGGVSPQTPGYRAPSQFYGGGMGGMANQMGGGGFNYQQLNNPNNRYGGGGMGGGYI